MCIQSYTLKIKFDEFTDLRTVLLENRLVFNYFAVIVNANNARIAFKICVEVRSARILNENVTGIKQIRTCNTDKISKFCL